MEFYANNNLHIYLQKSILLYTTFEYEVIMNNYQTSPHHRPLLVSFILKERIIIKPNYIASSLASNFQKQDKSQVELVSLSHPPSNNINLSQPYNN
jgi:hypothetical protein